MFASGQQENQFSDVLVVVPIVAGALNFPADGVVDLTLLFPNKMDATNNIKVDVDSGSKIYTGSVILTQEEDAKMQATCNELVSQYNQAKNPKYSVTSTTFICGNVA